VGIYLSFYTRGYDMSNGDLANLFGGTWTKIITSIIAALSAVIGMAIRHYTINILIHRKPDAFCE